MSYTGKEYYLSIPHSVELSKRRSWEEHENLRKFFTMRFNLILKERQVSYKSKSGTTLTVFDTVKGVGHKDLKSFKMGLECNDTIETIKQSVYENKKISDVLAKIGTKIGMTGAKVSGEQKINLREELVEKLTNSLDVKTSITTFQELTFETVSEIDKSVTDTLHAVAVYLRYAYDIFLYNVDYLYVEYKKSLLGLRKKRSKIPPATENLINHPNIIGIRRKIGVIRFWKLLSNATKIVRETDVKVEVNDPNQIEFERSTSRKKYGLRFKKIPTLYQLSNVAFPLRWIKLKTNKLTEDDLIKIEYEESKGSAWWFKYREKKDK